MIFSLGGVPGKLKTLLDRLTSARATKLDNLDAAISTTAPAATALSTATWTSALATYLGTAARRKPVTAIKNYFTENAGQAACQQVTNLGGGTQEKGVSAYRINSGALTANTLATMLTRTGAGVVRFLALNVNDTTPRTIRLKVTIDGTSVYDVTSGTITTLRSGIFAVGAVYDGTTGVVLGNLEYDTSLLIEACSSLTESGKIAAWINEEVR